MEQARENNSSSLVDRAVLDLLYPTGGYSSETGGKMHNLHTLTNAQVARYHKELYRPDNVCFILSGTAGAPEFIAAMEKIEARVLDQGGGGGATGRLPRPWKQPVAPMAAVGVKGVLGPGGEGGEPRTVHFPSEDESTGVVSMAWRGPSYTDQATWTQLQLLWSYLTEGAVAPITKHLVEVDPPLCSRAGPAYDIFSEGYHQVWFQDAKTESLAALPAAFFTQLRAAMQPEVFDIARMQIVIKRKRRQILEGIERAPSGLVIRGATNRPPQHLAPW